LIRGSGWLLICGSIVAHSSGDFHEDRTQGFTNPETRLVKMEKNPSRNDLA
jgi:hypothetical protein